MIMLYKYPGPHDIHGDKFDYVVVAENEMDKYLSDGWCVTTTEAKAAAAVVEPEPIMKAEYKPKSKQKRKPKDEKIIHPKDLTFEMKNVIANEQGSKRKIAEKYNVSIGTVYKIKVGKL